MASHQQYGKMMLNEKLFQDLSSAPVEEDSVFHIHFLRSEKPLP